MLRSSHFFSLDILTEPKPCIGRSSAFLTVMGTFPRWTYPEGHVRATGARSSVV